MSHPVPHVCLVNCQHVPDDVRVVGKLGRAMREAGMRVSWVGPDAGTSKRDEYGIEFHFFEPGKGRLGRLLRNHRAAFTVANALERADVYIGVEPDSGAVAIKLARAKGARAVFDVHEAYDDEMLQRWVPPLARPAAGFAVRKGLMRICARSDLVIGVNDSVLAPYRTVRTRKLVVRSCAPASFADGPAADVCAPSREVFTVMQGKSTLAHGTAVVVEALGIAAKKCGRVRGVFFEAFEETFTKEDFKELVRRASAEGAVDLRGRVHMTEIPAILRACDVGLISYDRTWGVKSLPNKLFEFMAAGLPIVAPSYAREIRPVIEAERCGLLVDCEHPQAIAEAIIHLRSHPDDARAMGTRAREAFLARHNFGSEVAPLFEAIREWSGTSAGPEGTPVA